MKKQMILKGVPIEVSGGKELSAGDGLNEVNSVLNVTNPFRGIYTKDEFDALSETEKAKGTYLVTENSSPSLFVNAPIGAILIWSGSVDDIPTGWALCDGQDGRPDLRGKFVLGAGDTYAVGATGGSETVTLTNDNIPTADASTPSGQFTISVVGSKIPTSISILPPYYALCYIIKVSATPIDGVTQEALDAALADNLVGGILTEEEFNALTEEQKASATYFVDDGLSGGSCGEIYDGQEQVIGTWFGKTLYQLAFTTGPLLINATWMKIFDASEKNIERLIAVQGIFIQSEDSAQKSFSYPFSIRYFTDGWFYVTSETPKNVTETWFIIKYTKATNQEVIL